MTDAFEQTDEALVGSAMRVLAQSPLTRPSISDAEVLWWRARVMHRVEVERHAANPMEFGSILAAAGTGGAALVVGAVNWEALAMAGSPMLAGLILSCLAGVALLAARAAWVLRRR